MTPNVCKCLFSCWFAGDSIHLNLRSMSAKCSKMSFLMLICRWEWYPCQRMVHDCKCSQTTILMPIIKRMEDANETFRRWFKMVYFLEIKNGEWVVSPNMPPHAPDYNLSCPLEKGEGCQPIVWSMTPDGPKFSSWLARGRVVNSKWGLDSKWSQRSFSCPLEGRVGWQYKFGSMTLNWTQMTVHLPINKEDRLANHISVNEFK